MRSDMNEGYAGSKFLAAADAVWMLCVPTGLADEETKILCVCVHSLKIGQCFGDDADSRVLARPDCPLS